MYIYSEIVKFRFLRFLTYPFEILASVGGQIIKIFFLILFWLLIIEYSDNQYDFREIIAYFLVAKGISEINMIQWGTFGRSLRKSIISGEITKVLIQPVSVIPHMYAEALGDMGMRVIFGIFSFMVGIFLNPPTSITAMLLFLIFFISSWSISFANNLFEGVLALVFTEAAGIKSAIQHIIRVFSGALIPVSMFPSTLQRIVKFTPFPSMIFGPVNALATDTFSLEVGQDIVVAIFWSIFLNIFIYYLWKKNLRKYEAIGI